MIGYRENIQSQTKVVNLFNTKYPETPVIKSCVSKIFCEFEELSLLWTGPGQS